MGNIQVLDQNTINQIAAGEVVERPASVVKELMENSIDAQATAITVEIKDGGISFIRITDNGSGIEKNDIKTAFLRHATSKIKTALDLAGVSSLGFRGEALSSIAAISMVELVTKRKEDFFGTRYEIAGGREGSMEDIGVPDGTTFIVRNIFYNTPARKKFLKTAATEGSYINDIVCKMALAHPQISFRFINNGKHVLHTSGNGNLKDVIYAIYGKDISSNLLFVDVENEFIKIKGYIGKPVICRGNKTYENYFINGRYIKSALIGKAIEEGYKNFMMQHKYPFTTLHFEINPNLLDVNVHPTKMDIRFINGDKLYPYIINVISDTLQNRELIQSQTIGKPDTKEKKAEKVSVEKTPEIFETKRIENSRLKLQTYNRPEKQEIREIPEIPKKEPEVRKQPKQPDKDTNTLHKEFEAPLKVEFNRGQKFESDNNKKSIPDNKPELVEENRSNYVVEDKIKDVNQMELFDDRLLSKKARDKHKIIGQLFETYWIIEYQDNMFIIDQHAAHEKVLYEKTMKRLKDRVTMTQSINPPIILTLTPREIEVIKEYSEYFKEVGYEIEEFGGNEYAVRSVPFDLYSIAKKDLLMEMIDDLADDNAIKRKSELITDRVATMSCKAAVKGNNKLSLAEANALIDELLTLDNPYNCPHGRPTIISMSKYEIEKKFKRIV